MESQDKKQRTGRKAIDLSGMRFGRLVAQYPTDKRDRKGSIYWHCRCDCGSEIEATADGLRTGNNKSCGCLKKESQGHVHEKLHHVDGTCLEWHERRKSRCDNTSGCRGVSQLKNGRYRAFIGFKGKRYNLGAFDNLEDAATVRQKAEDEIHGAFVDAYHAWNEHASREPQWGLEHPLCFKVLKDGGSGYRVICKVS